MRSIAVVFVCFSSGFGCLLPLRNQNDPPPATLVRLEIHQRLPGLLVKHFRGTDWTARVRNRNDDGHISQNPGDSWSETRMVCDVETIHAERGPFRLPVDDYLPILRALRPAIRDLIEANGGELIDYTYSDNYQERTLNLIYRIDKFSGRATIQFRTLVDQDDVLDTRVTVVLIERFEN